ncbi:hypothetical protein ACFY93_07700 [Streptomyces sp. NPDC008313]|uniref:hypothetical protein n=1 Tax=Streptomyces sp. NPDC008313 TaxID=3364826 RepID=UPI0036E76F4D
MDAGPIPSPSPSDPPASGEAPALHVLGDELVESASLISDCDGTPASFGTGPRDHLRALNG